MNILMSLFCQTVEWTGVVVVWTLEAVMEAISDSMKDAVGEDEMKCGVVDTG